MEIKRDLQLRVHRFYMATEYYVWESQCGGQDPLQGLRCTPKGTYIKINGAVFKLDSTRRIAGRGIYGKVYILDPVEWGEDPVWRKDIFEGAQISLVVVHRSSVLG